MRSIALFAYNFPHRKTHDFIVDLAASGTRDIVVLAAEKKQLGLQDPYSYYQTSLQTCPPINTGDLCDHLNIPFYSVNHGDNNRISKIGDKHQFALAIIAGARIICRDVIALFPSGIINFHPGKIPETSGLDSFFYTIRNNTPAGVTTHFIDYRVDAGEQIFFDEVRIVGSSTPETVVENIYQLQRVALRRVLSMLSDEHIPSTPIVRGVKNSPMTPKEKIEAISHFVGWRAHQVLRQSSASQFEATETGESIIKFKHTPRCEVVAAPVEEIAQTHPMRDVINEILAPWQDELRAGPSITHEDIDRLRYQAFDEKHLGHR